MGKEDVRRKGKNSQTQRDGKIRGAMEKKKEKKGWATTEAIAGTRGKRGIGKKKEGVREEGKIRDSDMY
ncbi:hypothetical protein FAM14222_000556 [Propionibacterium freudenreichii]|uniref:hypothetical protein n=1 Tax=Propionibacterium freudenreichii TaxID=1744 RepID=UPI00254DEDB3|nr:hypothetical protein [Propionibacterium freudenreichii]MDK9592303.1 hypothetical protein [Propionibacterium freudenreichii]